MHVTAKAPINIALIKYWGKSDEKEVIPYNDSLSVTLDAYHTTTTIEDACGEGFSFTLNGKLADEKTTTKVTSFLSFFADKNEINDIKIISNNTGPTAAGLASSASGFAALSLAANHYFNKNYDLQTLAAITRKGSGSACRSLLGGIVRWHQSGKISQVAAHTADWRMLFILVDASVKKHKSTEAMRHTVNTAPEYDKWVLKTKTDLAAMLRALKKNDFPAIGNITEGNALSMHKTMQSATPPIDYFTEDTRKIITLIQQIRKKHGCNAYVTLDAGPNVKILTDTKDDKFIVEQLQKAGYNDIIISKVATKGATILE